MKQYDIYWVDLNPTAGSEIAKNRPVVIVSPDEMNDNLNTVIIAPFTSTLKPYPFRVMCTLKKKKASIALDQIRTIDKIRILNHIGKLSQDSIVELKNILKEMLVD